MVFIMTAKDDLMDNPVVLKELMAYQKGSVVSRQLMKKEAGNVTLFAFDKNEGLSEHTAPFDALIYILDGEAEIFINKKCHKVKTGDTLIMPAHIPHALKAIEKFKMLLVMIKSE